MAAGMDRTGGRGLIDRTRGSGGLIAPAMLFAASLLGGTSAFADQNIGGAEIVVNQVKGNLASGGVVHVLQGDAVYRDEGVRTDPDSTTKLVLRDKTVLTVGPSSFVKLDRFVYAGEGLSGAIAVNVVKGALTFATGNAAKHSYAITTPTAALGVRGTIFRIEAALAEEFRAALRRRRFTEIFTSKIVASATEGGTNLFAIKYFDRAAYLAQSPQFYKEHAVAGMERVFETGHVYRAEPHASSRHLCEYLSLDLEMGFIDEVDDIIQLEREVLTEMFSAIREHFTVSLAQFDAYLSSLEDAPTWTFDECIERLRKTHRRADLIDDLDPLAERQLCESRSAREASPRSSFRNFR